MLAQLNNLLPLSVFTVSLLGSTHCAGMCGPFTLMLGSERGSLPSYHLARGIAYTSLGATAGAFGDLLLRSPLFRALPWLSGIFFMLYFLALAYQVWSGKLWHPPIFKSGIFGRIARWEKVQLKAAGIGLASILLPCGWLYSFLLAAMGTHSAKLGAITLFSFWLGTIPALSLRPILGKFWIWKSPSPRLIALCLLVLGVFATGMKMRPLFSQQEKASCHMEH